ncbi:predicted protein [Sclerotinia sclerotiorum 1980 UF-70]|uniref:Uncharacterized protein n=1 Tax=Sclerotinia sclerotiorum (strain ATCC 18683 / 1980 / Ss-1) TaxID=665079 RepID=A7E5V6_SCLS1|nr:predicted protein [Sclerotinia sclerotiorum 1980 UF-70]EDN91278.1 predicted protein [Sclerotinia sclerotiorum 1980 UF-70]
MDSRVFQGIPGWSPGFIGGVYRYVIGYPDIRIFRVYFTPGGSRINYRLPLITTGYPFYYSRWKYSASRAFRHTILPSAPG